MSTITDLTARRWEAANEPGVLKPVDALREAIRAIEAGEIEASHVIVCVGAKTEEGTITDWFQAGILDPYAQYGLLERVKLGMMTDAIGAPA